MNAATSDQYNHERGQDHNNNHGRNFGRGRSHGRGLVMLLIMVVDMIIKEISKRNFINRSRTIMRKMKKKGVKIMAKKLKIYVIVMVVKVIGPVPVIHQSSLLNSTKNHLKRRT